GFSRIPIYEDNDAEKVIGFVMRNDLLLAQARQQTDIPLSEFNKDMQTLLSSMPLSSTFELFLKNKVHILLVVDEYGGLEGILTLEDLLESILGVQIDDEKDQDISMRQLAAGIAQQRQRQYTLKGAKK
ncbi:MAG: CBS domain-containing protein, partial [Glaciecola sp.]